MDFDFLSVRLTPTNPSESDPTDIFIAVFVDDTVEGIWLRQEMSRTSLV